MNMRSTQSARSDGRPSCGLTRRNGQPCRGLAIAGTDRCRMHSGKTGKRAKAQGAVVVELSRWGLTDAKVDPAETLLRLLAQSRRRADLYAGLLQQAFDGDPDFPAELGGAGVAALIGHKYDLTRDGDPVAVAEAVRGLVELEAAERDRCARFAKLALDAGIAERQVRIAESQGALLASAMRYLLRELGLTDDQAVRAPAITARALRLASGSTESAPETS